MVRDWDNAFAFILPAVTDGGGLASETREQRGRLGHLTVRRYSAFDSVLSDIYNFCSLGVCLLNVSMETLVYESRRIQLTFYLHSIYQEFVTASKMVFAN